MMLKKQRAFLKIDHNSQGPSQKCCGPLRWESQSWVRLIAEEQRVWIEEVIGDGDETCRNLTESKDGIHWPQSPNSGTGCLGVRMDLASYTITGSGWGGRDGCTS